MAVGIIHEIDGMNAEIYDAINAKVMESGSLPGGLVWHAAGPVEGGWRVIEVWESREAFDLLRAERLDRASQSVFEARREVPGGVRITTFEVHNLLQEATSVGR